jgi:hypothetical protein
MIQSTDKRDPLAEMAPLQEQKLSHVTTGLAAHYLGRKPGTLRIWACKGGPIRPVNAGGRLAWPVSDIKRLLGV